LNSSFTLLYIYYVRSCVLRSDVNNKSDLRTLDFTVTRLLMKLFRTSNSDVINECCSYFHFKLPSEILPARFERFVCWLQRCNSWDCRLYCDHVV